MTKKCPKCGVEKDVSEFSKCKSQKDGLDSQCKTCRKEYRMANKERISEWGKQYRALNADKVNKKNKAWRTANKEWRQNYDKKRMENPKERAKACARTVKYKEKVNQQEFAKYKDIIIFYENRKDIIKKRNRVLALIIAREKARKNYYNNQEDVLKRVRKYDKKIVNNLSDPYIKKKIRRRSGLSAGNIPKELIELQRTIIIAKRALRGHKTA